MTTMEVFDMDEFLVKFGSGCLSLGQCLLDQGDDSHILVISEDIVETAEATLTEGLYQDIEVTKSEFPYVWLKVGDRIFRTLVVVLPEPDNTTQYKIMTDAHEVKDKQLSNV